MLGDWYWKIQFTLPLSPCLFCNIPKRPSLVISALSSNWAQESSLRAWSLSHWTTREFPDLNFEADALSISLYFPRPLALCIPQGNCFFWVSTRKHFTLWRSGLFFIHGSTMATHSSTLAWKIPWMEEPGRLQSMGSLSRARLSDFTFTFHFHALEMEMATHPVFLLGESQGQRSLVRCRLWGCTESDTTEAT